MLEVAQVGDEAVRGTVEALCLRVDLRITETGSKNWIQKLVVNGRQTSIGHGSYPAVTLAQARRKAFEAMALARSGGNLATRKVVSGAPSFGKPLTPW